MAALPLITQQSSDDLHRNTSDTIIGNAVYSSRLVNFDQIKHMFDSDTSKRITKVPNVVELCYYACKVVKETDCRIIRVLKTIKWHSPFDALMPVNGVYLTTEQYNAILNYADAKVTIKDNQTCNAYYGVV